LTRLYSINQIVTNFPTCLALLHKSHTASDGRTVVDFHFRKIPRLAHDTHDCSRDGTRCVYGLVKGWRQARL
jgi:hypothetical protein